MHETIRQSSTTHLMDDHSIRSLIKQGKYFDAVNACDALLTSDSQQAGIIYLKGLALHVGGYNKKAEPLLIECIAIDSLVPEYYVTLASIYHSKGRLEEAVFVADEALKLRVDYLTAWQIKALALTKLFRLQEAYTMIQNIQKRGVAGNNSSDELLVMKEDPEALFELALTIDPFKTKSRADALDTVKAQTSLFSFFYKLGNSSTSATLRGLAIFIGLVMSVSFFFRDNAQYQSFSLLIIALMISSIIKSKALSVTTNFRLLFPRAFRSFLQVRDVRFSVHAMIVIAIALICFLSWHFTKSITGIAISVIAVSYFTTLHENAPNGKKLTSFTIPKPKRSQNSVTKAEPIPTTVPLENVPYDLLYQMTRAQMPLATVSKVFRKGVIYSFLFVLGYPLVFLILKLTSIVAGYEWLVYPEIAVAFILQLLLSLVSIFNLPVFYPAAARKFIPSTAKTRSYLACLYQVLMMASLVWWIMTDYTFVLWLSGALFILVVRAAFAKDKTNESSLKSELIEYMRKNVQTKRSDRGVTLSQKEPAGSDS